MKLEYVLELGFLELVHGLTMSYERGESRIALRNSAKELSPHFIHEERETTSMREMHTLPIVIK